MAKSTVIAPLTGVRLVAAGWVVLFHIYLYNGARLADDHPLVDRVVGPIVSQGDLGVDLFFLLSGFVLAHNYLQRLGERRSVRDAASFVWARVARVWPLYMVATVAGGALLWLRLQLWGSQPSVPLTGPKFLEQVLMVQSWGMGRATSSSWTGPAWTISAEWLAYLCFPLLAVVVWRLHRSTGPGALVVLAGSVLVPTLVWTGVAQTQAAPFMWLARLASEFACGMLLSAAVRQGMPWLHRAAGRLVPVTVAAATGWLYLAQITGRPWLGPLVVALFPVLVLGLAHGEGILHRWLGSSLMVLGGGVSFALYLVHVPLLMLFRDALHHGAVPLDPTHQLYGELVVAAFSLLLAYALFRHVEEPLRHRMRALDPIVVALVLRLRALPTEQVQPVPVFSEHVIEQHARRVLV